MQFSFVIFLFLSYQFAFSHLCSKHDAISLLNFKKSFTILEVSMSCYGQKSKPKMSSWNMSRDCCSWDGVICHEMTGHVIELDLSCSQLVGVIDSNSTLFQLSHLQRLNLSYNDLYGSHISPEFDRFTSLTHLDLSGCSFSGQIPSEFSRLSNLQSLYLKGTIPSWLFSLPSLRLLDLTNNHFSGNLPESLSNLTHLEYLYVGGNSLNGTIPSWLFSLPSLRQIDLRQNHFSGQLEDFKSDSLEDILLGGNQLQGHLPKSIKNLVKLTWLDLSFNNFSGNVDINLFSDLKYLDILELSYNRISLTNENKVKSTLPESLQELELAACEVKDMEFLRSAKQLSQLDLSNNKIQGRIPDWAWSNWKTSLRVLNISHNMLTSVDSIPLQNVDTIDLRSNLLQGSLPIPPDSTRYLFISQNNLSGEIPSSVCNLTSMVMLDLARNNLKGAIPQCLGNINSLEVLDIRHNNLSGALRTTFTIGSSLRSLNLHGNKLEGKIPRSLSNCTLLQVVDLGDNQLNDTFPMWLGTLPELQVLNLRYNKLHGSIQPSRTGSMFPQLQIIDLSTNAFSGNLPTSLFQHLKAMRTIDPSKQAPSEGYYYQDSIVVVTKGSEREIVRILFLYTAIDLSNNKFEGLIPSVLGELTALRVLNLSHDGLQGNIPPSLGSLSSVGLLDLSGNHLAGEIPAEFASLTYLAILNLSYNHLEGCIPQGNQFYTFDNNSYEGNDGLRGFPVSTGCADDPVSDTNHTVSGLDDEESDSEFLSDFWKVVLMGYGSGLCIGFSIIYIIYFMISSGRPIWLARIIVELEYKKQQRQRNQRRRNNRF